MGISDFEQVTGSSRDAFRKALGFGTAESKRSKAIGSPHCSSISRVEVLLKALRQWARRESYDMNKCLTLVYLTTKWISDKSSVIYLRS
jgi:hypothetical protein